MKLKVLVLAGVLLVGVAGYGVWVERYDCWKDEHTKLSHDLLGITYVTSRDWMGRCYETTTTILPNGVKRVSVSRVKPGHRVQLSVTEGGRSLPPF